MGEHSSIAMEPIETASIGSHPKCPSGIFKERPDLIVADTERIIRIVLVHGEAVTVVFIEPIVGSKPHETFAVL